MPEIDIDYRERKGNFVHDFKGTPPGVHCPRFPVIAWAHGCQFQEKCSYCFLRGTFRMESRPVVYTNTNKLLCDIERDWAKRTEATLYNAGELSDSFLHPPTIHQLVRFFGQQRKHKLLLLTKDPAEAVTLMTGKRQAYHDCQTVVSFSINAREVSEEFETGAGPRIGRTVEVATALATVGYPVRLRIDPMIPIAHWQGCYQALARHLGHLRGLNLVQGITLGSLRYHPTVEQQCSDKHIFEYGTEWTPADRRWRVPLETRIEMYRSMIGWLGSSLPGVPVGLCKETAECFVAMGINPVRQRCNCLL